MANDQEGFEDNGATGEQAGRSAPARVEPTPSFEELFKPVEDLTPEEEALMMHRARRANPIYDAGTGVSLWGSNSSSRLTGGTGLTGLDVIHHTGHQSEFRGQIGRTMIQSSSDPKLNAIYAYESTLMNNGRTIVTASPATSLLTNSSTRPGTARSTITENVATRTQHIDRPDNGEHRQQTMQQSRREHAHDHLTAGLSYNNGTVRNARSSGSNNRNRGNTGRGRALGQGRRGRGSWNGRWNQNNRNTNRHPAWNSATRDEARSRDAQSQGRGRAGHGWRRAHQHQHGRQNMAHSHGVQQPAREERDDIVMGEVMIKEESPEVEFQQIEIDPDLHIKREPEW